MSKMLTRRDRVQKRHYRLRRHLEGTADRPRLAVFRSNKHIYAQLIDDQASVTLASASTVEETIKTAVSNGASVEAAQKVGALVAQRAREKGIEAVVFDRGGNLYHGRIAALASSAREAGLLF